MTYRDRHRDPPPPCFVCDIPGWGGRIVYGPTPSKDRRLCETCHRQGFSMELGEAPGRGEILSPEGHRLAFDVSLKSPPSKVALRRLRDADTATIPGTEALFR